MMLLNFEEKLKNGYYSNYGEYPQRVTFNLKNKYRKLISREEYKEKLKLYNELKMEKEHEFKINLLDFVGLLGHPKAEKAFQIAWDRGHSAGLNEVLLELEELADLIKD